MTISSCRISLMTRLLRSTAVNKTLTRSVPSRTASSLEATSSSLFLSCSFGSGLDVCPLCELRAGGVGAGLGLCPRLVQVSSASAISAVTTLIDDISQSSICDRQSSIDISLLVIQSGLGANQFYLDLALLGCLSLIGRRVKENVFLSQVQRDLRERAEQLHLLRRQEHLTSGFLAQSAEFLVVGVFNHARVHASEVLCAYAEDGHVVALGHLNRVLQGVLAGGVFAVGKYDDDATRVGPLEVGHLFFDHPIDAVVELCVAARLELPKLVDKQLLVIGKVLVQLHVRIERRQQDLILFAISGDRRDKVLPGIFLKRQLELYAVAGIDQQTDVERQFARGDELFDLLALSIFVDFEVIGGQTGQELFVVLRRDWEPDLQHTDLLRRVIGASLGRCGLIRFCRGLLRRRSGSGEQVES